MKNLIKKILFGDDAIKEYSTITLNDSVKEKVYLQIGNNMMDVSENQFLLCLEPVVFGIWLKNEKHFTESNEIYTMHFKTPVTKNNGKEKTVATVSLEFFNAIKNDDKILLLLKLESCKTYHVNPLKMQLLYRKYYKKPGFSFDKLKSFVSAYSYPRRVRIVSFRDGEYCNIFPMDLLGDIDGDNKYVLGLRNTNVTLSKIIETKKIVVSEISYQYKEIIYELGKHHGAAPPSIDVLSFKTIQSENFGFYIPEWVFSYKEIEIFTTLNLGSHTLLFGQVINEKKLKNPTGNLYHVHFLLSLYQQKKGMAYPLV